LLRQYSSLKLQSGSSVCLIVVSASPSLLTFLHLQRMYMLMSYRTGRYMCIRSVHIRRWASQLALPIYVHPPVQLSIRSYTFVQILRLPSCALLNSAWVSSPFIERTCRCQPGHADRHGVRTLAGRRLGCSLARFTNTSSPSIIIGFITDVQMEWQSISVYAWDRHVYVITTSEYYYYKVDLVNDRYNASLQMLIIPKMKATDQRCYPYSGFVKAEMDGLAGRNREKLMNLFIRLGVDLRSIVLRGEDISTS
jgi:hypothetical protein